MFFWIAGHHLKQVQRLQFAAFREHDCNHIQQSHQVFFKQQLSDTDNKLRAARETAPQFAPSPKSLAMFSCVLLFSNSGLDASVVRRQVVLFPSRWLCDSLKMREEDSELFLHND